MQLLRQNRRATEEHSNIGLRVLLGYRSEHSIPIRSSEVSGGAKGGDSVLLSTNVLDLFKTRQ